MRSKTIVNLLVLLASIYISKNILAAPAGESLAINPTTKKCAIFWAGDEFTNYKLPSGWETYSHSWTTTLITPYGKCTLKETDDYSICCEQLNLIPIDPKSVPYKKDNFTLTANNKIYYCELSTNIRVLDYGGISVNDETKECTALLEYNISHDFINEQGYESTSGETDTRGECLLDKNWKPYKGAQSQTNGFATPYGTCFTNDIQSCCKELGFKYVPGNIGRGPFEQLLNIVISIFFFILIVKIILKNLNKLR